MDESTQQEREIRAARNQALFRAVNAKMKELSDTFTSLADELQIACECADTSCVELVSISGAEYEAMRANPRQFAVRAGHVDPAIEVVIREEGEFIVVEKVAVAGEVAETLDHLG